MRGLMPVNPGFWPRHVAPPLVVATMQSGIQSPRLMPSVSWRVMPPTAQPCCALVKNTDFSLWMVPDR